MTADLRRLVARYGSPLYVYRLDRVRAAAAELRATLPQPSTLYYSLKANPHPDVVRVLLDGGCHAEISSAGETGAALRAGARDHLYTGPGKTDEEVASAIRAGVRLFSVESAAELDRLDRTAAACAAEVDCLVRVNVDRAVAPAGLAMAGGPSQFGTDLSAILADPRRYGGTGRARVIGLHFFTGTNVEDPKGLLATFELNIETAARLRDRVRVDVVDLGGGFAAPYARPGERPRYEITAPLEALLDEHLAGWRDGRPRVAFESGRHLVAESGSLACTVVDVKRSAGRTFVVLDSGIHHLGGMSGLRRLLPLAARLAVADPDGRQPVTVDLVGPLCTPADVLARGAVLPEPAPGDIVEIPNVGAYGLTASLIGFLGRPAPVEVAVDGDAVVSATRLVLGREVL